MMMDYEEAEEVLQQQQQQQQQPAETSTVLTTFPNAIPPEVMRLIFAKLPPSRTFALREICRGWMENIETMYIPDRHLLIYFEEGLEAADLASRFFAYNLSRFKRIPLIASANPDAEDEGIDYGSTLSTALLSRLATMFPNLEHLLVDTVLDVESANALISQLPRWTDLTSLGLFRAVHLPETRKVALRNAINRCHWLRRLGVTDLGRNWWRYLNFRNLEHFAYESMEAENVEEVVRHLTPSTYSLWTRCGGLSPQCVESWANINPNFVVALEQLHLGDITDMAESTRAYVNVSAFINVNDLRLQFESSALGGVAGSYMYATLDPLTLSSMARLHHLYYLELIAFQLDLAKLDGANLLPLETVSDLTLTRFHTAVAFDGVAFCRTLARLFPNVERLQLVVIHQEDGEAVAQSTPSKYFRYLQDFDFTVFVPPKRDRIFSYDDDDYDHAFE
ncbi:hypothetical protein TYRP_006077 [Tyrophagus putrescentiae]|nr:hypothetical protein TYRP_006077 [Tyrophagus putrescentiae]